MKSDLRFGAACLMFCCLLLSAPLAGCGKKGDPRPPQRYAGEPAGITGDVALRAGHQGETLHHAAAGTGAAPPAVSSPER